jgi:hypothetical protein
MRVALHSQDNRPQDQGITEVAPHGKGVNTQFVITCGDARQKDKKKKYYFKANTPEETKLWLLSINKYTKNLSEDQMAI